MSVELTINPEKKRFEKAEESFEREASPEVSVGEKLEEIMQEMMNSETELKFEFKDNSEEKKKSDTNSEKVSRKRNPASKSRANGKSGTKKAVVQPVESMLATKKPMALADMTLLPNQFMGTPGPTQAAPSIGHIIKSMLHFKWNGGAPDVWRGVRGHRLARGCACR